jgi:hypothetical protein
MQTLGLASNVYLSMATKYTVPETGRYVVGGASRSCSGRSMLDGAEENRGSMRNKKPVL